jgi:hypothetical protein
MSKLDGKISLGGHTLTFNVNTLCDLEEAFGADDINVVLAKIFDLESKPSFRTIRTVFAVAMRQEAPETTEQEAGVLITEIGLSRAATALGEGIRLAFPDQDVDGDEGNARPKAAGAGKKS